MRWERPRIGDPPLSAIDLGCGDGTETVELLRRGWRVFAVDAQSSAIELLRRKTPDQLKRGLTARVADFSNLALPSADLVYCGWSLPHCPASDFKAVWRSIRHALLPNGRFAGQILGQRDDWGPTGAATFDRETLLGLLAGLDVESLEEFETDRESFDRPKHWHYHEVIVQRSSSTPL